MNKILSFLEYQKAFESSEMKEESPEIIEILPKEKIEELKQKLSKLGVNGQNPGKFKFVDDEGVEYNLMLTPDGEIEVLEEVTESIKDKFITGVVCTMLASGLISCQKGTQGFGYNIGSQATEYALGKGDPNKKVVFSRPWGDEELEVDSNTAKQSNFWGGQGSKFVRRITPTEALILKAGHAYQSEKNMNNGRGTRQDQRWNYDPKFSTITGGNYYSDEPANFDTCREHPLWKEGLEILRKEGKDVDALIRKADEEVAQGIYFEVDK
jgi:hypothetical protein